MSFSITDHIDKLEITKDIPSEYTVECPVCNGKLKINKTTGAYACYTGYCSSYDIRNKIAPLDSREGVDVVRHTYTSPYVKPIDFPDQFYLANIKPDYNYAEVTSRRGCYTYYYSKRQRIKRIEHSSSTKEFLPETKSGNDWFIGTNNETFPFYNETLLSSDFVKLRKDLPNIAVVAEGEKKANIVSSRTGVLILSPAGFCYGERHLLKIISKVSKWVDGFIYLPDNDIPGNKKADLFQRTSWKLEIPCRVANLSSFFEEKGDDILDIASRLNVSNASQFARIIL